MKSLLLICMLFCLFSCTTREVEPTRQSRHTIDTLFQQKVLALQPVMDSQCDSLFPGVYSWAVDSISRVRKIEMNILVQ